MTQRLDWQTENLRFSFLGCTETAAELVSWKNLTGQEAESVTVKKAQGLRNEDGAWGGAQLTVNAQPGRVDIVVSPNQPPAPTDFPSLGDMTVFADRLLELLVELKMPQSARLAVGARLNLQVKGAEEAVDAMNQCLPFMKLDRESIDVVFQENKQKKLKHSGTILNRIFKWSQVKVQLLQFVVGSEGTQQVAQAGQPELRNILQLELDFNTAPNAALPHPDSYPAIVKEMFESLKQAVAPEGK